MWADWATGDEGADKTDMAAIHILLDGQDTMGSGFMALSGFGAKSGSKWSGLYGLGTPQTVL